jgi:hypothetical protein
MESAMILVALTISFWYFALVVAYAGFGTFSLMNLARTFYSRMSAILYVQARKLSTLSNLSTSLVLADILTWSRENDQKLKVLRI